MQEFSRRAQRLCWALYFIALLASYAWLPDTVGDPAEPMAKGAYTVTLLLSTLPMPWAMCGGLLSWVRKDARLLNLPHKAYWLAPERAQATWVRLDAFMLRLGWMLWGLFALIQYQTLASPTGDAHAWPALSNAGFEMAIGVCVAAVLLSVVHSMLAWRVPKHTLEAFQAQQEAQPAAGINSHAIKRPPRPAHTPRFGRGTDHGQPR
jgi:hypothetical protein